MSGAFMGCRRRKNFPAAEAELPGPAQVSAAPSRSGGDGIAALAWSRSSPAELFASTPSINSCPSIPRSSAAAPARENREGSEERGGFGCAERRGAGDKATAAAGAHQGERGAVLWGCGV